MPSLLESLLNGDTANAPVDARVKLQESVNRRRPLSLTVEEARSLLRLLERADYDPFVQSDDAFTVQDLSELGINTDAAHVQGGENDDDGGEDAVGKMLNPALALSAPDATNLDTDLPPPEIAAELQAFNDTPTSSASSPVTAPGSTDYDAVALALVSNNDDDDGSGILPESKAKVTLSEAGPADLAAALNAARKAQAATRNEKKRAAVAKRG